MSPTYVKGIIGFQFSEQWSDLLGDCNWYDITLINLEVEYDARYGKIDMSAGLLGFKLYIAYRLEETEAYKELMKMADEIKAGLEVEEGITARMEEWSLHDSLSSPKKKVLSGVIYGDQKKRFEDGWRVRTSTLESEGPFEAGDVVKTLNSTYLLGKPRDIT